MDGIKRKEAVVKGLRRLATDRLDRVIATLCAAPAAAPAAVLDDLHRVAALVAVFRRSMDKAAAQREQKVLRGAIRRATPRFDAGAALKKFLKKQDGKRSGVTAEQVLCAEALKGNRRKRSAGVPDPAVHRLIAELSEVRMRAGYWHVQAEGFAAIRPGLRGAYTSVRNAAAKDAGAAALLGAVVPLMHGLRVVERAWPEMIRAERRVLRESAGLLGRAVELEKLGAALRGDGDAATRLVAGVEAERVGLLRAARSALAPGVVEMPGRFVDRHGGYWSAWRGEGEGGAARG